MAVGGQPGRPFDFVGALADEAGQVLDIETGAERPASAGQNHHLDVRDVAGPRDPVALEVAVEQMANAIVRLKAEGLTVLLSEQNLHFARLVKLRIIGRIRRIEPDHALFAAQIFERGFLAAHQSDDDLAVAGEHGKGFAVVAAEVRNLAEQSKTANTRIRHMLSEIRKAAEATVVATDASEAALAEDWNRAEEDAAWAHLQPAKSS